MRKFWAVGFLLPVFSLSAPAMPPPIMTAEEMACRKLENPQQCLAELEGKRKAAARADCESQYGSKACDEFDRAEMEGQQLRQRIAELYTSLMKCDNKYYRNELEESHRSWGSYMGMACSSRMRMLYREGENYMYSLNVCMNELGKARLAELSLHLNGMGRCGK